MKTKKRYKSIGGKIKSAREAKGMSQRQLAEAAGFDSTTAISLIEAGERKVSIAILEKIARALKIGMEYFLGYKDAKVNVETALRASDLDETDKKAIARFIELAKARKHGRKRNT
jgi:transcriptional regulator with XRE-family HTH domain